MSIIIHNMTAEVIYSLWIDFQGIAQYNIAVSIKDITRPHLQMGNWQGFVTP